MLVTQLHNPTKLFVPCQRVNFPVFVTRLDRFIVNALFSIYSSLTEKNGKLREKKFGENDSWGKFHQHSTRIFYAPRSQKHKKIVKLSVFFVLSVSSCAKAARRTLMKLTPGYI